jgi:hypothetical protein
VWLDFEFVTCVHHVVESDLEPKAACVPYMPGPVASKVEVEFYCGVISRRVVARETLEVVHPDSSWICVELRDRAATAWAHRLEFLEFPLF